MEKKIIELREFNVSLPQDIKDILRLINNISSEINTKVYLVGGYVRDLILGRESKDLDFVVSKNGIYFIEELHKILNRKIEINREFKTGKIILDNDYTVDIVTARKEIYKESGTLPIILDGKLIDDIKRRDFTVNTLLLDFSNLDNPKVYDYLNGIMDLKSKLIKVLHNKSFIDDPTRIYRALRLSSILNFHIENNTFSLLKEALEKSVYNRVSYDRLFTEILKSLEKRSSKTIELFIKYDLLDFISQKGFVDSKVVYYIKNLESNVESIKDKLGLSQLDITFVKLLLLTCEIPSSNLQDFLSKISITKDKKTRLLNFNNSYWYIIKELSKKKVTDYEIYITLSKIREEEMVCFIIISNFNRDIIVKIKKYLYYLKSKQLLITGKDLKKLGIKEGPIYSIIFERLQRQIINGQCTDKEKQIEMAVKIFKNLKGSD